MYTEFVASLIEIRQRIDEAAIADAFEQLDVDSSGYISQDDLQKLLGNAGTSEYTRRLVEEADLNKDGLISYEEFNQYLMQKNEESIRRSLII